MPKFIFIFILLLPSFLFAQEKQEKEGETLTQVAQKNRMKRSQKVVKAVPMITKLPKKFLRIYPFPIQ
ncbi:hypothetical protein P3339_19785 [Microbulbifer sp. MLAF003]|uniref:hypothetical protein n=1 Tax=Microbulbifer sp. MLAF003 TaxID=3032582 RepID=UPI0024AD7047|nr:hypothetical protein [Microbulbifer sp. MLAF003]WHI50648.1 hypothetical protein P3339_19785 [Microbulbifer sp. MLAF003]